MESFYPNWDGVCWLHGSPVQSRFHQTAHQQHLSYWSCAVQLKAEQFSQTVLNTSLLGDMVPLENIQYLKSD